MQDINWGNFRAKFNGKEEKSFEWLSYLLFCDEFHKSTGIFRYKNQPGIETEPTLINGEWVGFQAKFYDTKISENASDIKESIRIAKAHNLKLQRILFYINQEFSEGKEPGRKAPQYQIDIEKVATEQGIQIEWKVPSHFEAQLALDRNRNLAQHFFSLGKSIVDFIEELHQSTERLFEPIHSKMELHGREIKIDRSRRVEELKAASEQLSLVILSGEAGVGKTAVVKDLYDEVKEEKPFFAFKATAFNISHINRLFQDYGAFTFSDFIDEHKEVKEKYVVIDSAERLSDLDNQEVFQEFLSALVKNHWNIIFTTRYSFLENLKIHFLNVYRLPFKLYIIERLTSGEIKELSKTHQFPLPQNERLLDLIGSLFYLNEYVQNYQGFPLTATLSDFKSTLWNKIIQGSYFQKNTHLRREECFLKITQKRANEGTFFVEAKDCDDEILYRLEADEIIKRDSNTGSYFITHDIYEELALDKIIERAFRGAPAYKDFFTSIGTSLSMRRAFRVWLSEKLFSSVNEVKGLIEYAVTDNEVEKYWKDEVQVSVLLSEYADSFFQLFEAKLLEENQSLLVRLAFLLRRACKELDEDLLQLFGIDDVQQNTITALLTKPRGRGWNCTISFIHAHLTELGSQNMSAILPLLEDWVNKNKGGDTTKKASQIALFYYEEIMANGGSGYSSRDNRREQLFKIILQGASEIKDELNVIFEEVIREKQTKHDDKHYALVKTVLTSPTDSFDVARNLPEQVLRLADLFWSHVKQTDLPPYASRGIGVEEDFGIAANHLEYYPASAFQTPIFFLLRNFPMETMNFILAFTNKTTEAYAKSDLDGPIEEVDIFLSNREIKQYISDRLWCMYRGTQVAPDLLESIHMALEKWLLDYANMVSPEHLESVCRYLISKSTSASLTAVITSVVLANPEKLFNIAAILFQTKQFFLYDTNRWLLDQSARNSYSIGYGSDFKSQVYRNERIKTCDDSHRKLSLESIVLKYQVERCEGDNDAESERKQRVLWGIFDNYYKTLPDKENETEYDKTWRLYLARMDARKMKAKVEEKDGRVQVTFHPEIEPELRAYSEASIQESAEARRYIPLKLWSDGRFKKEEKNYKQYPQYENDPQLVITETKDIVEKLQSGTEEDFPLLNASIPAYTCSVLLRDYFDKLSAGEREFCKDIVIEFASLPLDLEGYQYQVTDGTEPSITSLPGLLTLFPEENEIIVLSLFLLLLNPWKEIATFGIKGVFENLWERNFQSAQSVFLGYILLKQKYDDVREEIRSENYQNEIYRISENQVIERFEERYEQDLDRIVSNEIAYDDLKSLEQLSLETLGTAFELLPLRTENEDHKKFFNVLFSAFSKRLFRSGEEAVEHTLKQRFLKKFAYFLLHSSKKDINIYLQPFLEHCNSSESLADLFSELIFAEETLNQYEEFWIVWNTFYEKIVEIAKKSDTYHYTKLILRKYLLAWPWREGDTEWHSVKEKEKFFFSKAANDMGHCAIVLYSLAKVLNDIGSNYLEDGITWISTIIEKNENLLTEELETNTLYYLENLMRRYISKNRLKLRTTLRVKKQVIIILNFLVERGSTTGYWLRDDVL